LVTHSSASLFADLPSIFLVAHHVFELQYMGSTRILTKQKLSPHLFSLPGRFRTFRATLFGIRKRIRATRNTALLEDGSRTLIENSFCLSADQSAPPTIAGDE
jgi:hypothetical protein